MKHKLEVLDRLQRTMLERVVDMIAEKDPGLAEVEIEFDVTLNDTEGPVCSVSTDEVAGMLIKRIVPCLPDAYVTGSLINRLWRDLEMFEWEWRADNFRELQEEGGME